MKRVVVGGWLLSSLFSCAHPGPARMPRRVGPKLGLQQSAAAWPAGVDARQYQLLRPHFVPQRTDASCSAAAAAMVVNTLRAQRHLPPLGEAEVAAVDATGRWRASIAPGADGVDLDTLRLLLMRAVTSLAGPAAPAAVVDAVHMRPPTAGVGAHEDAVRGLHYAIARSLAQPGESFVVINAVQSLLFRGGESVGHFAVVGALNEATLQALVFDIDDVEGLEPFWLELGQLVRAMQQADALTGETRGYLWVHR